MSYSYYDFNHPRVLVEIDCGKDGCKTTAQVLATLKGHISEGGSIEITYDYAAPIGWSFDRDYMRYRCALHNEE